MTAIVTERPDHILLSYRASNENKTIADFHMYLHEFENTSDAQTAYDLILRDYGDWDASDTIIITQYDDGVRQMHKEAVTPSYYIAVLNDDTIMIVNSVDTEKETVDKYLKQFNFYVDETTAENISPEKSELADESQGK